MTQICLNKIILKIKGYLKENWGSPFIVAFILFLISAAGFLSIGSVSLADNIAVYSYYALVAGILMQLVSFLKYRWKNDHEVDV
jgi:hypothetical protein